MSTSSLCPFLPPLRDLHIVELIILHPDIGLPLPDWVPPVPPILLLPWVHITLPIAHPSLCSKSLTRHVVHVHVPRTKWLPSRRRKRGAGSRDRIEQTNEVWYGKRDTPYTPLREKVYCSLLPTHANSQVGLQITTIFIWLTSDIHCSGSPSFKCIILYFHWNIGSESKTVPFKRKLYD